MKLLPSQHVLCTPYNQLCTSLQSHVLWVHVCEAVTCHLHFWQNDDHVLCATVVTQGWNGYRNKSQHRKLTMENKSLPLFLPGLEPATFKSLLRCSITELFPLPCLHCWTSHLRSPSCELVHVYMSLLNAACNLQGFIVTVYLSQNMFPVCHHMHTGLFIWL